jgi:hypothetical protein
MNSLRVDLTNKVVVLKEECVTGTTSNIQTRIFRCKEGPGCNTSSKGVSIKGQFLGNRYHGDQTITIDGSEDILRLAQQREVEVAQL